MNESDPKESESAPGVVKDSSSIDLQEVAAAVETRMQVLIGPSDGATNFAMRKFVMDDGGGMPRHTNEVEHEQYVLRGRAEVTIGNRRFEVGTGDVLLIPPRAPHSYTVVEGPFEFLCLVPNTDDKIRILKDEC